MSTRRAEPDHRAEPLAAAPPTAPLPGQIADEARQAARPQITGARADHAPGAPAGLPWQATPAGRAVRHAQGLYAYGQSTAGLGGGPPLPEDEADAFDAPPLPYMRVDRPAAEPEAD